MALLTKTGKKQDSPEVDFRLIWIGIARVLDVEGVEPPKTIEDLKDDSVSRYTKLILDALVEKQILYKGYLIYRERVRAIAYLTDVIPLISRWELPEDVEGAKTFIEKFAFAPVRSRGTEYQSLFSRIGKVIGGHWLLPDRYNNFPVRVLLGDWEALYPENSPFEKFDPTAIEEFLENY